MATDSINYAKPPIVEAVVEFRVSEVVGERVLEKIAKRFIEEYPIKIPEDVLNVRVDGDRTTQKTERFGFRVVSADGSNLLLLRTNGLTVARLAPYPGWSGFEDTVQNTWKIWRKHTGALQIARIGVRFVNRIDIPNDGVTPIAVENYLNFNVRSPANNLPPMANFQIQSSYASPDTGFTITLNSAPVPSPLVNHLSIVLDIDIGFQIGTIISDSEMWERLREMRKLKNQIFEECITNDTRKLFS